MGWVLTSSGRVQRRTGIVSLGGDLNGRVLCPPTLVFGSASDPLVDTGSQVFSGTVLGSVPVIVHDGRLRFEVDLGTGATIGQLHLSWSGDAPHPGSWPGPGGQPCR